MTRLQTFTAVAGAVLMLSLSAAFAAGPRGFRADWRRADTAISEALNAAYENDLEKTREEAETATDALLNLSAYTPAIPIANRENFTKTLSEARMTILQVQQPGIIRGKDDAVRLLQITLQKFVAARSYVPGDWFQPTACVGMRRQRRQC